MAIELLDVRPAGRLNSDQENSWFGAEDELVCFRSTGSA